MKSLILFTILLYFTLIVSIYSQSSQNQQNCSQNQYDQYLKKFNLPQSQPNSQEYQQKYQRYCTNLKIINEKNSLQQGYKAKQYKWMDKSQQELKGFLNFEKTSLIESSLQINQKQEAKKNNLLKENQIIINGDVIFTDNVQNQAGQLPVTVDHRTLGHVSSIKDQGICGCCWAFASTGLYQSWMMWKGQQQYDLSEQFTLQCTSVYTKSILKIDYNSTCQGGIESYALSLIKNNGIPDQKSFPYKGTSFPVSKAVPQTSHICQAQQRYLYAQNSQETKLYTTRNTSQSMLKYMLAYFGPVTASIYSNQQFLMYSSGVFDGCSQKFEDSYKNINHAVLIVGYDSDGNYIIKNSWGTNWGMNGFGIISKNRNCGINAQNSYLYSQANPGSGVKVTMPSSMGSTTLSQKTLTGLIITLLLILTISF